MATTTVVDDYILKAVQRAEFEWLEDGSCTAWVPGFPGLIALGRDGRACVDDLWRRLDDWIARSVERHFSLPVLDGIDFNNEESRRIVSQRRPPPRAPKRKIYLTDEELFRSLGA